MPEEGISLTSRNNLMTLDERKRLIHIFSSLGANKLRFTGGEPTISNQLGELIKFAASCNPKSPFHSIGITSNGLVLGEKLNTLVNVGMTSINISLDTLSDEKFATITRRDRKGHSRVLAAIYKAVAQGIPVKVNVVLMRGVNDMEVASFVELTRELRLDVRFIELMPFDGNEWAPEKFMGYLEVIDRLKAENVSTSVIDASISVNVLNDAGH
jgi:cyclic pyranopterin phosphate synthase